MNGKPEVDWERTANEALDKLEALRELQIEIEHYALRLEPDVVMYRSTPSLSSLADWAERFLTIMRVPKAGGDDVA